MRASTRPFARGSPASGLAGPTPIVLFRESTVAGHFVSLAGVEGLASHVTPTGGRLPRRCTPERCEVVRLRGAGALPDVPGLRLVEVGTATLRSSRLFGDFLAPTDNALADREVAPALQQGAEYHRPAPAPLVVAEGIEALTRAPALANTYRSYAWVWPLAAGRPRLWEIDDLVGESERARAALSAGSIGYSVQAPVEELRATEEGATAAGRRLLLVGGEAAALLFAFAVLAARGMRRDLEAARRRLTWYGARRWHLRLLTVVESALVAVVGAVGGWLVGVLVGGLVAERAGAPVGAVLRESVFSTTGLAVAAGVVVLATAVIAVATSVPAQTRSGIGPVDVAAIVALLIVVASLAGGAADTSRLARDQTTGLVLLLLPGLIAFAAAVAAARLFGPLVRVAGRLSRRSVGTRLAAITLGRGPGAAGVTVAFLTLAFALALLAEGYRSTLVRAERDQASFAVPLDVVVREDLRSLVPVLDAAPVERYDEVAQGATAVPILRIRTGAGNAEGIGGVTLLGLPADEIPLVNGWRDDFSEHSRSELAALVRPSSPGRRPGNPARVEGAVHGRTGSRLASRDDRNPRRQVLVPRSRPALRRCADSRRPAPARAAARRDPRCARPRAPAADRPRSRCRSTSRRAIAAHRPRDVDVARRGRNRPTLGAGWCRADLSHLAAERRASSCAPGDRRDSSQGRRDPSDRDSRGR